MKFYDTLGRRTRQYRQPHHKALRLQPRDIFIFQKLHEHGCLPTPYLYAFTKHIGKDYTGFVKRLNQLFHAGFLNFPPAQRDTENANSNYYVHSINNKSESVLHDHDLYSKCIVRPSGPWKHQCMVSCITASIELATYSKPLRYIPAHEILQRTGNGLRATVSIRDPKTKKCTRHDLVPDSLFGLEYQSNTGNKYLTFLVEADRATERIDSDRTDLKTFKRNVLQYREFIGTGMYKTHFGITSSMLVLTITTKSSYMQRMLEVMRGISQNGKNSFMLFQEAPEFGRPFKPTTPVLSLVEKEWSRTGYCSVFIDQV